VWECAKYLAAVPRNFFTCVIFLGHAPDFMCVNFSAVFSKFHARHMLCAPDFLLLYFFWNFRQSQPWAGSAIASSRYGWCHQNRPSLVFLTSGAAPIHIMARESMVRTHSANPRFSVLCVGIQNIFLNEYYKGPKNYVAVSMILFAAAEQSSSTVFITPQPSSDNVL